MCLQEVEQTLAAGGFLEASAAHGACAGEERGWGLGGGERAERGLAGHRGHRPAERKTTPVSRFLLTATWRSRTDFSPEETGCRVHCRSKTGPAVRCPQEATSAAAD